MFSRIKFHCSFSGDNSSPQIGVSQPPNFDATEIASSSSRPGEVKIIVPNGCKVEG